MQIMSNLGDVLSKLVYSTVPQTGVWGRSRWLWGPVAMGVWGKAPSRWAIFVSFWKKSYFNPIGSHFARVYSHLKELDF